MNGWRQGAASRSCDAFFDCTGGHSAPEHFILVVFSG